MRRNRGRGEECCHWDGNEWGKEIIDSRLQKLICGQLPKQSQRKANVDFGPDKRSPNPFMGTQSPQKWTQRGRRRKKGSLVK